MTKRVYSAEDVEEILLMLPVRRRVIVLGKLLKSLKGNEADEGWIEELQWRLQDWRAKRKTEPLDDLLDGSNEQQDELFDFAPGIAA
ncbi:MAG TPA: hypothetical protein VFT45_22105 [Longimicrobium sp.]|nr:hypothetical protein [Longimicrobium sp.]